MATKCGNAPRPVSSIDAKSIKIGNHPPATNNKLPIGTSPEAQDQLPPVVHHPANPPGNQLLGAMWRSPDRFRQIGILNRVNSSFKNLPVNGVVAATFTTLHPMPNPCRPFQYFLADIRVYRWLTFLLPPGSTVTFEINTYPVHSHANTYRYNAPSRGTFEVVYFMCVGQISKLSLTKDRYNCDIKTRSTVVVLALYYRSKWVFTPAG